MKMIRLSKIAMAAMIALLTFLITLNNILDYDSNYEFVRHVLSMEDTSPTNTLISRAVAHPILLSLSYWTIIVGEGVTCLFFLMGSWKLWRAKRASGLIFNQAKKWVYAGATMAMLVWFLGFMVIGGEYFLMWQSAIWNGQESAFRFYMSVLAVLVYINQTDYY